MTDVLRYEQSGDVAWLRMDDGKANAYGPDMIAALGEALDRAERDPRRRHHRPAGGVLRRL